MTNWARLRVAGYQLVGMIDTPYYSSFKDTPKVVGRVPVLGGPDDLLPVVGRYDVDEVIDAIPNDREVSADLLYRYVGLP